MIDSCDDGKQYGQDNVKFRSNIRDDPCDHNPVMRSLVKKNEMLATHLGIPGMFTLIINYFIACKLDI